MRYEQTGLWVVFSYLPEHNVPATEEVTGEVPLQVTPQITPEVPGKTPVETGEMSVITPVETKTPVETPVQTAKTTVETVETPVETPVKTPDRIIELLRANPQMTLAEVAEEIGRSRRAVERATTKLVADGRLRFVGPRKSGHWETLE